MERVKYSYQREVIKDYLLNTKTHPTVESIYENLKKRYPELSLATVYRNVKSLCEEGTVIVLKTGDKKVHYDGNVNYHTHFICNKCGKIIDLFLEEPSLDELNKLNLSVERQITTYYGLCDKCKK
ncbi:MAG: transcriptional repressor [Clostridia bacterium]|nr:transcriptional repressor [Clostridia bacterium]